MISNSHVSGSGIGLGGIVFMAFLAMKIVMETTNWVGPRFLWSTEAWWDGWFMVFLPLWALFAIAIVLSAIVLLTTAILSFLKH